MKSDTVFEVKHYLSDIPSSSQESCFNLLKNGAVLDVFTPIGDIEGIEEDPVLNLVYAAYTDSEAKKHLVKVRAILGFTSESGNDGTRSYPVLGAGSSNFSTVKDLHISTEEQVAYLQANPFTPDQLLAPLPASELVAPLPRQPHHAVRSLNLSHFNPPPAHLQLKGHLFYIQVSTLEGKTYHITASTAGFFVNNTTSIKFDATPTIVHGKPLHSHSLFTLIKELSPAVEETLADNAERFKDIDPHVYLKPTNTFFASPWMVNVPAPAYPDFSKTQDSLFGTDAFTSGTKDWNEELQAGRELPKATIQDRISREGLMNKLSFEFAEAAAKGALSIIKGNITALNSSEPEPSHIFLHNGIFYSYGVDGTGIYGETGGDAAARYTVGKEPLGVNLLNKLDAEGLCPLATAVIDFGGRRILAQTPVPGIFQQNPEGESQIAYGSIENKESIVASESFAPFMATVSDAFHVKAHTAFDNSGNGTELVSASTINGLLGTDHRKYILDLHKLTPLDLGFYDDLKDSEVEYPHKVGTLRTEAVEEWWRINARKLMAVKLEAKRAEVEKSAPPKMKKEPKEGEESKEGEEAEEEEEEEEVVLSQEENQEVVTEASAKFRVNPDVPLDLGSIPTDSLEDYKKDAEVIREISTQIKETWIPSLLAELKAGSLSVPFDGTQLTSILHKRGINMRYLGQIAKLAAAEGASLDVFSKLVVQEIVARSVKHTINAILADFPVEFSSEIVPHYLNCLLGYKVNEKPEISVDPILASLHPTADVDRLPEITVESVREEIAAEALRRFRFTLGDDWVAEIAPLQLLREVSVKCGFQWKGRNYNFETVESAPVPDPAAATPAAPKKNKKSKAAVKKVAPKKVVPAVFTSDDFLNIVPLVSSSSFRSQIAEETLEAGRLSILKGEHEAGLELLSESLTLHEHVYGAIHPETARIFSQLALVYSELKNGEKGCEYGRKAVIIQELCHGVDSSETMLVYLNLALFEHANSNTVGAMNIIRHAFRYLSTLAIPEHPDFITTMNNIATMLQNLKLHDQAVKWYEASLKLTLKVHGASSPNLAALHYQISQSHVVLADYNAAVESMRESHRIFNENFGADDNNTKETKRWLDQLLAVAVSVAKANKNAAAEAAQAGSQQAAVAAAAAAASASRRARLEHARAAGHNVGPEPETQPGSKAAPRAVLGSKSISELVDYINGTAPASGKTKSKKKAKKN